MGKSIIQQARGRGGPRYRVRRSAFNVLPRYPTELNGEWEVVKLISRAGHTAPVSKLKNKEGKIFFALAGDNLFEGQKIMINRHENNDIAKIGDLKNGTKIFNLEARPKDGGKLIRSSGNFAEILNKRGEETVVLMPSKQEKIFSVNCRATIGKSAGAGRLDKPILKAGKQYYIKKAKSKLWPRTSAVKMNAVDHPFGSGRGKRPKSKISKRMAPAGRKVGLLRPRRTGRKKK